MNYLLFVILMVFHLLLLVGCGGESVNFSESTRSSSSVVSEILSESSSSVSVLLSSSDTDYELDISSSSLVEYCVNDSSVISDSIWYQNIMEIWNAGDNVTELRTGGCGNVTNYDAGETFSGTTISCGGDTFGGGGEEFVLSPRDMEKCKNKYDEIEVDFHIVSSMDISSVNEPSPWYFGFGQISFDFFKNSPEGEKVNFNFGMYGTIYLDVVSDCEGEFQVSLISNLDGEYIRWTTDLIPGAGRYHAEDFYLGYLSTTRTISYQPTKFESIAFSCMIYDEIESDVKIVIKEIKFP